MPVQQATQTMNHATTRLELVAVPVVLDSISLRLQLEIQKSEP